MLRLRHPTDDVLPLDQLKLPATHPAHLPLRFARVVLLVRREAVLLRQAQRMFMRQREDRMRLAERVRDRDRERALRRLGGGGGVEEGGGGRPAGGGAEVPEDERGEEVAHAGEVAGDAGDAACVHDVARGSFFAARGGLRGGGGYAGEEVGVGAVWVRWLSSGWQGCAEPVLEWDGTDDDVRDVIVFV